MSKKITPLSRAMPGEHEGHDFKREWVSPEKKQLIESANFLRNYMREGRLASNEIVRSAGLELYPVEPNAAEVAWTDQDKRTLREKFEISSHDIEHKHIQLIGDKISHDVRERISQAITTITRGIESEITTDHLEVLAQVLSVVSVTADKKEDQQAALAHVQNIAHIINDMEGRANVRSNDSNSHSNGDQWSESVYSGQNAVAPAR